MAKKPKNQKEIRHPMWLFLPILLGLCFDNLLLSIFLKSYYVISGIWIITIGIILISVVIGIVLFTFIKYTPSKAINFEKKQILAILTWIIVIGSIVLLLISDLLITDYLAFVI